MIEGNKKIMSEKEYRNIYLDSSSSLKIFSQDRKKYFRMFIEGNTEDNEDDTKASIMGRIVEVLLLEPDRFDELFYMSACMNAPTGLMLEFVEALYRITKEATDKDGNVTREFEDISRDAYKESGFKIKYEAVINKFVGSDAEIYYQEIRRVRANNLTVITTQDLSTAERIVEELKSNPVTSTIVNLVNSERYEVINQMKIEGYTVEGHQFKSMIDKVIVDHTLKTINPYDLKCVWAVENFFEEYYLYRRAYIQAYLYYSASLSLILGKDSKYAGYTVEYPQFIVCDSTNYYNPLIYKVGYEDLLDARQGFEYKGRLYPGVSTIINDLKFALDKNIWNMSRENYNNSGIVNIRKR